MKKITPLDDPNGTNNPELFRNPNTWHITSTHAVVTSVCIHICIYIKWSCIECTTFLYSSSGFEVRWTHIYTVAQRHATWHSFFGQYCVTHLPSSLDKAPLQAQCRTVCLVATSSSHDVPDCGLFFLISPANATGSNHFQFNAQWSDTKVISLIGEIDSTLLNFILVVKPTVVDYNSL